MNCQNPQCGREIVRGQFCAETPAQFAKRLASGFCRPKCARSSAPAKKDRPKPSLSLISNNTERGEMVAQPKIVPVVDEAYRKWIRSMPCLVPGCPHEAHFHHQNERGHGGKGALCSDYRGVSLCTYHHTNGGTLLQPGSYHGMGKVTGWKFWQFYGVDVEATIHRLNAMWFESGRRFKED